MRKLTAALAACLILSPCPAAAYAGRAVVRQGAGPEAAEAAPPLSEAQKKEVLDSLVEAIRQAYLYPDRVDAIRAHLEEETASGAWSGKDEPGSFGRAVTDSLRAFTGDLHFALRYDPVRSEAMRTAMEEGGDEEEGAVRIGFGSGAQPPPPDSPMYRAMMEMFSPRNFSMTRLEVLDGNVGYFRLEMFPPLALARPTLDAAMSFLAHTDAMIIDLRATPGGVGGFLPYLASWFFEGGGKLLYSRRWGAEGRTEEYRTEDSVGGERRPRVPLYILTDSMTGSAAENFAYTMKHHGRATVVGETTAGAGHSARGMALSDGFMASIPAAEVIHPVTGKGFDAAGVKPDVEAAGSEALEEAHALAVKELLETATGERRARLEAVLHELEAARRAEASPEGEEPDLMELTGTYGPRTISVVNSTLRYQREGGPQLTLRHLEGDIWRMDLPAGVRAMNPIPDLRFERDGSGKVNGFSLVRQDGTVEEFVGRDS